MHEKVDVIVPLRSMSRSASEARVVGSVRFVLHLCPPPLDQPSTKDTRSKFRSYSSRAQAESSPSTCASRGRFVFLDIDRPTFVRGYITEVTISPGASPPAGAVPARHRLARVEASRTRFVTYPSSSLLRPRSSCRTVHFSIASLDVIRSIDGLKRRRRPTGLSSHATPVPAAELCKMDELLATSAPSAPMCCSVVDIPPDSAEVSSLHTACRLRIASNGSDVLGQSFAMKRAS
ncbi:hypothetical protein EVAR_54569_1 [Eumeta japonica]|uniref:Uncharacterized protein n=1 Tax=Eumeta variegata TaxID=151549 RepID=A0A4C1YDN5_EUMVA|nr:hypothetical protein EVAR_54569_1 [Eumeta japonica]